jgi:hypothetical protein
MKIAVATALSGVALLASGCGGDSQAQVDDSTFPSHGSGSQSHGSPSHGPADALVLRTMTTGGIAGLGAPGTMPDFSLYGDGRAITGGARPLEYHLTPQALHRLIADARMAGLATSRTADNPNVADAMYKTITFVTGGRARTTKVIQGGGRAGDPAENFLPRLVPARWPRSDQSADPAPYRPSGVAVLAGAAPRADGTAPRWPLKRLTSGTHVGTRTCTVLTGADAAAAQRLAARPGQWTDHGQVLRVTLRPLLPDERDCAALNHRS